MNVKRYKKTSKIIIDKIIDSKSAKNVFVSDNSDPILNAIKKMSIYQIKKTRYSHPIPLI